VTRRLSTFLLRCPRTDTVFRLPLSFLLNTQSVGIASVDYMVFPIPTPNGFFITPFAFVWDSCLAPRIIVDTQPRQKVSYASANGAKGPQWIFPYTVPKLFPYGI